MSPTYCADARLALQPRIKDYHFQRSQKPKFGACRYTNIAGGVLK